MDVSSKRLLFTIWLSLTTIFLIGQNSFNVVPQTLGQSNQSRLFDSYPDSNIIYVFGDLLDTTIDSLHPSILPWWGVLNYNGELLNQKLLYNKDIKGSIVVPGNTVLKNSDGNLIYNTIIFNSTNIANSIIFEIDRNTGDILKFKVISNPIDTLKKILPAWITFENKSSKNIIHAATLSSETFPIGFITKMDENLNSLLNVIIDDNGRNNYIYYVESNSDSTFILLGESKKRNDHSDTPDVKPYFMKVNTQGKIIEFKLAVGIKDKTVFYGTGESYTIAKDNSGNWIFGGSSYFPPNHSEAKIYSYTPDFETLNWVKNISEDSSDFSEDNTLFSAKFDSISNSLVACGSNLNKANNDSYVVKIKANGDSVWTRHFIPLNWDPDSVAWAWLRDIRVTKFGTYVCVGHASNLNKGLWRPWAINIDSFGCLVPGCQNPVSILNLSDQEANPFVFFPNPSSSQIGLLCNTDISKPLILTMYDSNGVLVKDLKFNPIKDYQYIIDTSIFNKGIFFIRIQDFHGAMIQVEKIIIN